MLNKYWSSVLVSHANVFVYYFITESDNEKVTDTSKVTGGHRWMPVFLVVFVVVVLSVTPFLLQHYKQTDSGNTFTSVLEIPPKHH